MVYSLLVLTIFTVVQFSINYSTIFIVDTPTSSTNSFLFTATIL